MDLRLKIPPVVYGLAAVAIIWLCNAFTPLYHVQFAYQNNFARALVVIGMAVALSGILTFVKLRTTIHPNHPNKTSSLATIGIYKYSRNPMYLGILLNLLGIVLYFGALSSIVAIWIFVSCMTKYQIVPEEVALQEKFGESYTHYLQNVRRWL